MKYKGILQRMTIAMAIGFLFMGFNGHTQDKWVAPASTDKIINPLKDDANAAINGQKLFKVL